MSVGEIDKSENLTSEDPTIFENSNLTWDIESQHDHQIANTELGGIAIKTASNLDLGQPRSNFEIYTSKLLPPVTSEVKDGVKPDISIIEDRKIQLHGPIARVVSSLNPTETAAMNVLFQRKPLTITEMADLTGIPAAQFKPSFYRLRDLFQEILPGSLEKGHKTSAMTYHLRWESVIADARRIIAEDTVIQEEPELPVPAVNDHLAERLRNGQLPVVEALLTYLSSHTPETARGYIVAPTGSGKTVVMATMLEELRLRGVLPRTFITVPTKRLVDQTYNEFIDRGFKGDLYTFKHSFHKDKGEHDVIIGTQAAFTRNTTSRPKHAMYAIQPSLYNLIILDEGHHVQGLSTQWTLHQNFKHAAVLAFTATDDYDSKRLLSNVLPDKIFEIFTKEGVEQGLIAPYVTAMLATPSDMSNVRVIGLDYDQRQLESALNTDMRNFAIAKFVADNLRGKKILFNVGRVHHAVALAEAMRHFGFPAAAVHGGLSDQEYDGIMDSYANGSISAITQAKLLGEGWNDPTVDVVINVTPTLSWVREKQRTGRGQRIDPNQPDKTLLVIECIDQNYRINPILYGHSEVTGNWQVVPGGIKKDFQAFLNKLSAYDNGVVRFTADPEIIEQWNNKAGILKVLFSADKGEVVLHSGDVKPVKIEDLVPPIDQTEVTKPIVTKPLRSMRLSELGLFVPNISAEQQRRKEIADRLHAKRTNNHNFSSDSEEEREPEQVLRRRKPDKYDYYSVDTITTVTPHNLLDSLSPRVAEIARYILGETELPPSKAFEIKAALVALAGKPELKDQEVLKRYQALNLLQSSNLNLK